MSKANVIPLERLYSVVVRQTTNTTYTVLASSKKASMQEALTLHGTEEGDVYITRQHTTNPVPISVDQIVEIPDENF
jgi:hypothetical protein